MTPAGPAFLRTTNAGHLPISNVAFRLSWTTKYYFGHLNSLESSVTLVDHVKTSGHVFYRVEELNDFKKHLREFDRLSDLPKIHAAVRLKGIAMPLGQFEGGRMRIQEVGGPDFLDAEFRMSSPSD